MAGNESASSILLVEDSPQDAELTRWAIEKSGIDFSVRTVERLSAALEEIDAEAPAVVLLDLGLPDASEMEGVLTILRHAPTTPIVILSGQTDERMALDALELGAQDYVVKGSYAPKMLARVIRYSIERKRTERELMEAARFDPLTGLANRSYFLGLLEHALDRARRSSTTIDVLFLDLDRFKNVNDSLGHEAGDDLLRQVAERVQGSVRVSDIVARLGGDEFTVMIEGSDSAAATSMVAHKILDAVREPFQVAGVEVIVTPSIGIAGFPRAGDDAATLLRHADAAMYTAKSRGRNTAEFFTEDMNAAARAAFEHEMALRRAASSMAFDLHYQPIMDRATGKITGAEALLRWRVDGSGPLLAPGAFLPVLEKAGLMPKVGLWVLYAACVQCREWQESLSPDLRIAVNVSPRQLADRGFAERVAKVLRETALPPEDLSIEITEEVLLESCEENLTTLRALRELGVEVAIDDFGSGYSSLSYLTVFPFDTVKIDRSFIEQVDEQDKALITAGILSIASGLGRRVVAEGVETEEQLDFLAQHGCPEVQGYLFSRPLSPIAFEAFLKQPGRPLGPDAPAPPAAPVLAPDHP